MKKIIFIICLMLFILPFFWITPGELEMGGDSNRLFLYDPGSYLQVNALYSIEPQGVGKLASNANLLPFLVLLQFLNAIFHSPYILMSLLNSIKLVGSFFFMYLIVAEILSHHFGAKKKLHADMAGILSGLFYTLSPSVGENMRTALLTHNQVFLNPLNFYLLLRLFVTHNSKYLWLTLLTTFIFSPNFSLIAPPPPFAFYPLALLFLILYVIFCLKKSLPWKQLCIGLMFFLGIHAFQIIPGVAHILDPSSDYYTRALDATTGRNEALDYFDATLNLGKVSQHLFLIYSNFEARWTTLAVPFIIILGFILYKKRQKAFILISIFFFITLFLVSANITRIGVQIYGMFFYIPGFSMFRVFYGQWQFVYIFFYALLFGFSLYFVFMRLKLKYVYISSLVFVFFFIISGWIFISGKLFRAIHSNSKNMTSVVQINPDYEKTLGFIRALPDDGKIFNFPFNDFFYQVVPGTNNAAYIGPSPTSYLTGKRTFSGYQIIYPFPEVFLKLAKEKNYAAIKRLFGLLNVRYILYIKDPKAFTDYYPTWPYSLFLNAVPNPRELADFVDALRGEMVFSKGEYFLYESNKENYLPHFFVPARINPFDDIGDWYGKNVSFFVGGNEGDPRVGYIDREQCNKIFSMEQCKNTINLSTVQPTISFQRINPIKYSVVVSGATGPFTLIFSDQFHKEWKLFISESHPEQSEVQENYFNGSVNEGKHKNVFWDSHTFETLNMKSISENRHFMVNGYANAWLIKPEDASGADKYEIIVEMTQQRYFYYGLAISAVSLVVFMIYGIKIMRKT